MKKLLLSVDVVAAAIEHARKAFTHPASKRA
jgi:hypothetical protein